MSKMYDPNVIPDWTGQYPPGRAHVRIESMDDSEPTRTNKYQIRVVFRGIEPADVAEQPHFERFVIGTDDDPKADDPDSWKGFAARRYKDMLTKAGVQATGSVAKDIEVAVGQQLGIVVANEVQKDKNRDGTDNPYAGRVQANIRSFFAYGEQPVGDGGFRAPQAGQVPTAPARPAPAPARPTRAAAPTPVTAAPAPAAATVMCSICSKAVPKSMFAAHVAAHEAAEE